MANRIASILPEIISPSQTAFIKGRRITDNILLAQELFSGFHVDTYSPKYAMKVDFRKAYDTLDWNFLENSLKAIGFPAHFTELIMSCVRSPKFSVAINGELHGFFGSRRGLRQGDPISPYLFTIAMEVLSGILETYADRPEFRFYWRCKASRLTHLFFADDVFIFSEGHTPSVLAMKEGLDLFSRWSGLVPNTNKSEVFLSGGPQDWRNQIIGISNFREGSLPVRYLGVPIITARLSKADCSSLVCLLTSRVQSWTHRFLSFAGRVQLIKSVLYAIQSYWAAIFWLPASVVLKIEQICRQFLWKGPALGVGGAKVSWDDICCPKQEGGLGIRKIRDGNKAAMIKHIWILFTDKESLWCKWVHTNYLKRAFFWTAKPQTYCSWAWRKILALRDEVRTMFRWKVGDGLSTSLWFDPWAERGLLSDIYSHVDIYNSSLTREAKVADLFTRNGQPLVQEFRALQVSVPTLTQDRDKFLWTGNQSGIFSIASAWAAIRRTGAVAPWATFVWDKSIVPRHQFLLWLISKKRLPTQVLLMSYGRIPATQCVLCHSTPESIEHLFFECHVSRSLANFWAARCNVPWHNRKWLDNIHWLANRYSKAGFYYDIVKFSFGALCYVIWKTRNDITFRSADLFVPSMKQHLTKAVKDKALACRSIPDEPRNRRLQRSWGFDPSIFR